MISSNASCSPPSTLLCLPPFCGAACRGVRRAHVSTKVCARCALRSRRPHALAQAKLNDALGKLKVKKGGGAVSAAPGVLTAEHSWNPVHLQTLNKNKYARNTLHAQHAHLQRHTNKRTAPVISVGCACCFKRTAPCVCVGLGRQSALRQAAQGPPLHPLCAFTKVVTLTTSGVGTRMPECSIILIRWPELCLLPASKAPCVFLRQASSFHMQGMTLMDGAHARPARTKNTMRVCEMRFGAQTVLIFTGAG